VLPLSWEFQFRLDLEDALSSIEGEGQSVLVNVAIVLVIVSLLRCEQCVPLNLPADYVEGRSTQLSILKLVRGRREQSAQQRVDSIIAGLLRALNEL
jgi:hypothetical protein